MTTIETDWFAEMIANTTPAPDDMAAKMADGAARRLNYDLLWSNHEDTSIPRMVVNGVLIVS